MHPQLRGLCILKLSRVNTMTNNTSNHFCQEKITTRASFEKPYFSKEVCDQHCFRSKSYLRILTKKVFRRIEQLLRDQMYQVDNMLFSSYNGLLLKTNFFTCILQKHVRSKVNVIDVVVRENFNEYCHLLFGMDNDFASVTFNYQFNKVRI